MASFYMPSTSTVLNVYYISIKVGNKTNESCKEGGGLELLHADGPYPFQASLEIHIPKQVRT